MKAPRKTLVVLFQRGAADGLNIVPPFRDANYRRSRPAIRIEAPTKASDTIDLDGTFGLHSCLSPLLPLWKEKRFAIVHAVGSPDLSRSHEEAQDYMEWGAPRGGAADGWLNRALQTSLDGERGALDGVAILRPTRMPEILRGAYPVTSASSLSQLPSNHVVFEKLYRGASNALLRDSVGELEQAHRIIDAMPRLPKVDYVTQSEVSRDLDELVWIIKADVGLRVAFLDMPSEAWDHHYNENARMHKALTGLGGAVAKFYNDLGDRSEDILLLTMTEFGRTLRENVAGGTDHGRAGVMMLFGGKLRGGRVYGRWPGLEPENLVEGRDLQVTTDFRQVLGEALTRHLGIADVASVFPGGPYPPLGLI